MGGAPPIRKDMQGLLQDHQERLDLLERRRARGGTTSTPPPTEGGVIAGIISPFGGGTIPSGWLLCDGSAVPRGAYPDLFTAIGVTWGAGNGSTTFNLPNLKGRVPVGRDAAQAEFDSMGETGGAKTHTLTVNEIPDHTHAQNVTANPGSGSASRIDYTADGNGSPYPQGVNTGGISASPLGQPHNNLQPYAVANYIISTGVGAGTGGGIDIPVQLWNEFHLAATTGTVAAPGGQVAWDGPVTGNLDATLSADKKTITLSQPGTYRILPHMGVSAGSGAATNANADINGVAYVPSFGYGAAGPAGSWSYDTEFYITITGPTTIRYAINPASLYFWSWVRIEKQEPIFVNAVTAIVGRATIAADGTTPATAGTTFNVNWSAFDGPAGIWSSGAPSRFVLNKPGRWRVGGKIRMNGASLGWGYMNIWRNGTSITQNEDLRAQTGAGSYPACEDIISSNGTDYIEFRATNSNASQTIQSMNCLATLEWIGA
jgi:microcystin-dependent protein